jgi:hypothetical protein
MAAMQGIVPRRTAGTGNALKDGLRHPAARVLPETRMSIGLSIGPVVALVAGILILIIPRLLNYIIALYLIIIGILGLMGSSGGVRADATGDDAPSAVHSIMPEPVGKTIGI